MTNTDTSPSSSEFDKLLAKVAKMEERLSGKFPGYFPSYLPLFTDVWTSVTTSTGPSKDTKADESKAKSGSDPESTAEIVRKLCLQLGCSTAKLHEVVMGLQSSQKALNKALEHERQDNSKLRSKLEHIRQITE